MNSAQWYRVSKKIYIYNSVITVRNLIFYFWAYKGIIGMFKIHGNTMILLNFCSVAICAIMLFKKISEYYAIRFSLSKESLIIKKGFFNVQTYAFDKENVHLYISNIRFKSNFIQKILNIVELEILLQNGEREGIIRITALEPEYANAIREWFNNVYDFKYEDQEQKNKTFSNYTVPLKYIFVSSLVSANYFFLIPLSLDIQEWLGRFHIKIISVINLHNNIYITIFFFFLILFLFTFVRQYLKFGKFFMRHDMHKFYIKNGFFNNDTNIVEKNKIKGLIIEQSLGMRLLHLSTIAVITINNGELHDTQSKNYLLPFIKDQDLEKYINNYFPDYKVLQEIVPRERRLLFVDIFQCLVLLCGGVVLCIGLFKTASYVSYAFLFVFLLIIFSLFRQFTSKISIDEKKIQIKLGILTTRTYVLLNENIECLDVKVLQFKKKTLKRNIKITLHSTPAKKIRVLAVPLSTVNRITEKLSCK